MWKNKNKAITFSFDDAVTQDIELIKILNDYGLKATFNISSGILGQNWTLNYKNSVVNHNKILPEQIKELYLGHEIAVHSINHLNLTKLKDSKIIEEVENDRVFLENLVGYEISGMAYPYGAFDQRVINILKNNTNVKYCRTVNDTLNFNVQSNLLCFNPTIHFGRVEKLWELADSFLGVETEEDIIFYIWGHSYELDGDPTMTWKEFEKFCKYISNKKEIFYGTNAQILLK